MLDTEYYCECSEQNTAVSIQFSILRAPIIVLYVRLYVSIQSNITNITAVSENVRYEILLWMVDTEILLYRYSLTFSERSSLYCMLHSMYQYSLILQQYARMINTEYCCEC